MHPTLWGQPVAFSCLGCRISAVIPSPPSSTPGMPTACAFEPRISQEKEGEDQMKVIAATVSEFI
eukprot:scaffold223833_cov17-Tisochrysis_lutea.AAC.2